MAKPQASKPGSTQKKAPATAQIDAKGARLTVDTTGMTPEQVAALAEDMLPKRKPRNKVSTKTQKVPENAGQDTENVKSAEDEGYTDKQRAFVDEYLVDLNATQAAIRAGYSRHTANEQASRLLANVKIQKLIAERKAARVERTEITQDRVLQELYRLCFVDVRKFFNADGTAKPITELDDDAAAALAGFEVNEIFGDDSVIGNTKKFKLTEKKGALELLMRHMGMLNDKLKLQGDPQAPLEVKTKVVLVPQKQAAEVETRPLERPQD